MKKKKGENEVEAPEETSTSGEQLDLIEVAPENAKKITGVAKRYRAAQARRIQALDQECNEKQALLALIKEANLKQVDGKIKFRVDGLIITVTPRDELIKIKDESEENPE